MIIKTKNEFICSGRVIKSSVKNGVSKAGKDYVMCDFSVVVKNGTQDTPSEFANIKAFGELAGIPKQNDIVTVMGSYNTVNKDGKEYINYTADCILKCVGGNIPIVSDKEIDDSDIPF